ncbi:MAG: cupin domain-containing protein [Geminicoccaceae bacterium]
MSKSAPQVVNINDVKEIEQIHGDHWGGSYKPLTPSMQPRAGRLGVNLTCVPPGRSACPFHAHQREDEVFYVLSGRGVFRYGDSLREVGPGDCIACPAGTGTAHQLANPFDQDLTYLAIGPHPCRSFERWRADSWTRGLVCANQSDPYLGVDSGRYPWPDDARVNEPREQSRQ